MDNILRGSLCFKGERGYSAYEIAVKNGFEGSEKDWLAQLGTTAFFSKDSTIYTATAGQTSFDIPKAYTSGSEVDVYINGVKLNSNEYKVNEATRKIELVGVTLSEGTVVEVVVESLRYK